jgi:hypothetical protein
MNCMIAYLMELYFQHYFILLNFDITLHGSKENLFTPAFNLEYVLIN